MMLSLLHHYLSWSPAIERVQGSSLISILGSYRSSPLTRLTPVEIHSLVAWTRISRLAMEFHERFVGRPIKIGCSPSIHVHLICGNFQGRAFANSNNQSVDQNSHQGSSDDDSREQSASREGVTAKYATFNVVTCLSPFLGYLTILNLFVCRGPSGL